MSDLVTLRISSSSALSLQYRGELHGHLIERGIDPRQMSCVEEGDDLVYSSERLKEAAEATKIDREGGE